MRPHPVLPRRDFRELSRIDMWGVQQPKNWSHPAGNHEHHQLKENQTQF